GYSWRLLLPLVDAPEYPSPASTARPTGQVVPSSEDTRTVSLVRSYGQMTSPRPVLTCSSLENTAILPDGSFSALIPALLLGISVAIGVVHVCPKSSEREMYTQSAQRERKKHSSFPPSSSTILGCTR